jgi:hypothetical protein
MEICPQAMNSAGMKKRKDDDLFFRMTTIVLEMIKFGWMSNAARVYNAFKSFSEQTSDAGANMNEDCWLRSAFMFGEIMVKVKYMNTFVWKLRFLIY